jgi:hypothetical protein
LAVAAAVAVFLMLTSYVHTRLTDGHLPGLADTALAVVALLVVAAVVGAESLPLAVLLDGLVVAVLVATVVVRSAAREEIG